MGEMEPGTTLERTLQEISDEIDKLREHARALVKAAPITDTELEATVAWWGATDRYLIILPDGRPYYDVPGVGFQPIRYTQRPAAIRHATGLPGARVYDCRERKVVFTSEAS
jgi:hypothetical protein